MHDGRVHVTAAFDHALSTTDATRAVGFEVYGVAGGDELPPSADLDARSLRSTDLGSEWHFATITGPIGGGDGMEVIGGGDTIFRRELSAAAHERRCVGRRRSAADPADVVAEIASAVQRGRPPRVLESAIHRVSNHRRGFFASLRDAFPRSALASVEVVRISAPERPIASGAVFRVHARRANLRGPSDAGKTRSVLCGLVPITFDAIRALYSREAVTEWVRAGGEATANELAWL